MSIEEQYLALTAVCIVQLPDNIFAIIEFER